MSQTILFAIIIGIVLIVLYHVYATPETFVIFKGPQKKEMYVTPLEAARKNIVDYAPVYDGQDRVF